jgi:serine/threonine protein kinase
MEVNLDSSSSNYRNYDTQTNPFIGLPQVSESEDEGTPLKHFDPGTEKFSEFVTQEVIFVAKGKAKLIGKEVKVEIPPPSDQDKEKLQSFKTTSGVLVTYLFDKKKPEVRDEFEMKTEMKSTLEEGSSDFVDFDFEEVGEERQIKGQTTYEVPEASGDLEGGIQKSELPIKQRFDMGNDVLKGMSLLHEGNYLHRDLKPENFLIVTQSDPNPKKPDSMIKTTHVKVTDFGKTKLCDDISKETKHVGNTRYAPPEGKSSDKAEVYSVGLILVRIFEEEFLTDVETSLIEPALSSSTTLSDDVRGIEKYIVQHPEITGCDTNAGLMKKMGSRAKQARGAGAQNHAFAVNQYKNALIKEISAKHSQEFAGELDSLLTDMLDVDPSKRPSMREAQEGYQAIAVLVPQQEPQS